MRLSRHAAGLCFLVFSGALAWAGEPYWVAPMRDVNARFDGNPGYVAQFGDSITYSSAFWKALGWDEPTRFIPDDGLTRTPKGKRWRDYIKGQGGKGSKHGNYSGWRVGNLLRVVDSVLKREQPEAAIIMIGTNDIGGGKVPGGYRSGLETVIRRCLDANCVPIVSTIPPKRRAMAGVEGANAIIRELARQHGIPLVDYCAEVLKRRRDDWDGTLISKDGVHPSGGKSNIYTEANLRVSGYALRNWVTFMKLREVHHYVLSRPKPFTEQVGTVETEVRPGIRCEVIADTQVSTYRGKKDDERLWNWGRARRIKSKGYEEYCLFKFDTRRCRGMTVRRATLYLSRTDQCVMNVVETSSISTDWREGTGSGDPGDLPLDRHGARSVGGATYLHAAYPDELWAGPGSNLKFATFGEGGSVYGTGLTVWARIDTDAERPNYYVVDLPLDVAHSLLVEGDGHGLAVVDAKGQRGFQNSYRRVPNPNHFLNSRESGKPCFLVIDGERVDTTPPATISDLVAAEGQEAGEVILTWTCPGDDGAEGGKALGYEVHYARRGGGRRKLARAFTYRPGEPGSKQTFFIDTLEPGTEYVFDVAAYDEAGNRSGPARAGGTARASGMFGLDMPDLTVHRGAPIEKGAMRIWACPSNAKINPMTGNSLAEGNYEAGAPAGGYRRGNAVWNGRDQVVSLVAGTNDFAGFQVPVENTTEAPLSGVDVKLGDFAASSPSGRKDRLVFLSESDPAAFQTAMTGLMAKDEALAMEVFEDIRRLNADRYEQQNDPLAFFRRMDALRRDDPAAYRRAMYLIGGGKGGAAGAMDMKHSRVFWAWGLEGDGRYYPDALLPMDEPVEIPNARNGIKGQRVQAFYVDVFVPHRTKPGGYLGEVIVSADGAEPVSVPVELKVHDFQLPDWPTFYAEMNGYGYSGDYGDWDGVLDMHRLAHRNRVCVNVVPYSHSGNWTVPQMGLKAMGNDKDIQLDGLDRMSRHFGPLVSGRAFRDNPRKGVPVTGCYLPLYENWPLVLNDSGFVFDQTAQHVDVRRGFPQAYRDAWVAAARRIFTHLRDKGHNKTVFQVFLNNKYQYAPELTYWLLDEPMFRDDFLVIQMFGELARRAAAGVDGVKIDYRIDCSRVEEARHYMNTVDLMVFSQANLRAFPILARDFMRVKYAARPDGRPRQGWVYGGTNAAASANTSNRAWCVEAYVLGMEGLLPWLALGTDASWDRVDEAKQAVFYPGRRFDRNGAFGSLRLKAFRDGEQDAEYLELLRRKTGATRRELGDLIGRFMSLKAETETLSAEDAGTVSFRAASPDKLEQLRRILAHNIAPR
ncbi:MAG: GDSL-type esterase/lipase family protein [Planctomycetota bacterium]|jgi:lysophospholipase L1-like esterase